MLLTLHLGYETFTSRQYRRPFSKSVPFELGSFAFTRDDASVMDAFRRIGIRIVYVIAPETR